MEDVGVEARLRRRRSPAASGHAGSEDSASASAGNDPQLGLRPKIDSEEDAQLTEKRRLLRQDFDVGGLVLAEAALFLRLVTASASAAELVDEAARLRGASPDQTWPRPMASTSPAVMWRPRATGRRSGRRSSAACRGSARAPRRCRGGTASRCRRARRARSVSSVTPSLAARPLMSNLPVKMPIEPVIVDGAAKISGQGGGDEVAARGGDVAERADDRLDRARALELARDDVGGERRAAGRVDAQDDRAHARVVARLHDRGQQRLHADELHAEERNGRRLAVDDVALDEDDRDRRGAAQSICRARARAARSRSGDGAPKRRRCAASISSPGAARRRARRFCASAAV